MLTYNRPQLIERAISSVRGQSFGDWELLVVQDGSNPQTARLLTEWMAKDARIQHLPRGTVGPIAEASNFGLSRASGEYIAILDDDDAWAADNKLARQVDFLDSNPEYVACGGGYILEDQQGRKRGRFLKPEHDADIRSHALLANPIANSTAMFRRVIGGTPALYDLSLRGYADWDFWLALGGAGKLYNFPCVFAYYALWEGGGSFWQQKVNARSGLTIVCKHRREYNGFPLALLLAALHYGYACLPAGIRSWSYKKLSALKKTLASSEATAAKV